MRTRNPRLVLLLLLVLQLFWGRAAVACALQEFQISTQPRLPAAGEAFELTVDYLGSEGCILAEELVATAAGLQLDISCDCPFITTNPVPQQFLATVPGLPAGLYAFEAIHVDSIPAPRTVGTAHILIGHAPSIPVSPLALTLLALTLAAAAVWVLRR